MAHSPQEAFTAGWWSMDHSPQGGGAWSTHRTYEGELYYYNQCSGVAQWEAPLEGSIRAAFVIFVLSIRAPSRVADWNPIIITNTAWEIRNIEIALRNYGYLVRGRFFLGGPPPNIAVVSDLVLWRDAAVVLPMPLQQMPLPPIRE